jgi:hypothetical protein
LRLSFGDQLQLVGWELVKTDMVLPPAVARRVPQPDWQLALYWQAISPPAADYTVSVRPLVGGTPVVVEGEALIQDHQPVWGLSPTSQWRAGELIRDVYALAWPDGLPNPDAVQILVYRPTDGGFENLAEQIIPLTSDPTEN